MDSLLCVLTPNRVFAFFCLPTYMTNHFFLPRARCCPVERAFRFFFKVQIRAPKNFLRPPFDLGARHPGARHLTTHTHNTTHARALTRKIKDNEWPMTISYIMRHYMVYWKS